MQHVDDLTTRPILGLSGLSPMRASASNRELKSVGESWPVIRVLVFCLVCRRPSAIKLNDNEPANSNWPLDRRPK